MKQYTSKYKQIKACFTTFVISRFAPDYEKTKAENKKLRQDIYNLIKKENEIEGITTKARWEFTFNTEEIMMFGDATKTEHLKTPAYP